jgi:crotonobetainyl-CoA:carnitine CoA-transferase CaiB-like acyl-CoA transferase
MQASEGDTINSSAALSVQNDPDRFGMSPEETFVIHHYQPILAERVAKFTAREWTDAAAIADVTMQEVRSPEDALADPLLIEDGCVRELEDPELGTIRQVGTVLELSANPCEPGGPAPRPGQHNAEIRAEAASLAARPTATPDPIAPSPIKAPLEGIRVLDLGLAIAGPYGTQLLADLGADVIKVNALWDSYWHSSHVAYTANRNKRSICLNLKHPDALAILLELVKTADVVQHNMRYDAAMRMGTDYESLKKIKPDLIYCHTRGHDRGPRESLPGNDQTGACIAGVQYEDGAVGVGGRPLWSLTSFGDTGNGYLSAVGIMNALYHRNRTGEGQFIDTAIVNAQLLASSYILGRPDGTGFDRPRLDRMQTHLSALYGLYETTDGWLAVVATNDAEWEALKKGLGDASLDDAKFASVESRDVNDAALRKALEAVFAMRTAAEWLPGLRAAGAAVEFVDPEFSRKAMDDPELIRRRWILSFDHPIAGKYDQSGLGADFSETPAVIKRAPLVVGECTREILAELGYSDERIESLKAGMAIGTWQPGEPVIMAFSAKQNVATEEPAEA